MKIRFKLAITRRAVFFSSKCYQERRQDYVGDPLLDIYKIDAELVESVLFKK